MNSFGRIFRISLGGESHGGTVFGIIDGCPPGVSIGSEDFVVDLARRQGGNIIGSTPRKEADIPDIRSGVFNGYATGAPILIEFANSNVISRDYEKLRDTPRPGHADFVAHKKFNGFNDYRGGGHFSGRLTAPLVACGVVAKKVLGNITINAKLKSVGGSSQIDTKINEVLESGDSVGGIVECCIKGLPVGLGEPFFDSFESILSHGLFSIPAIKGVEFGVGFASAELKGSEMNDQITNKDGGTATNNSGGINGGITNGNDIIFRVAIKPTSSIKTPQKTIELSTNREVEIKIDGRHDACIALRIPPVVEAISACVCLDLILIHKAYNFLYSNQL